MYEDESSRYAFMLVLFTLSGLCLLTVKGQANDIVFEMKRCYEIGGDLILNATYNGNDILRNVVWLYNANRLSVLDPGCQPFINVSSFPLSRMTFKCPSTLGSNKFQVNISGLQASEIGDIWGAQFKLMNQSTTQNSSSVSKCTEPSDPQYLKCYNATETSCDLIWTPGFDGGNSQTFVIMFKEFNDSSWRTVTVPGSPYQLRSLQPGRTYLVQVYATNSVGKSNTTIATNCTTLLHVSDVTLNATSIHSNIITVTRNMSTTLTCTAGFSIPAATVMLFIGDVMVQNGTTTLTFMYIPNNSDHDKNVLCEAFNLQESPTIGSPKYKLYLQVPVSSVIIYASSIQDDIITVTSDVATNITCTTDFSRPDPTVMLFIGDALWNGSQSVVITFSPKKRDHDKNISCKAYNMQDRPLIESQTYKLFVQVQATTPTLVNQTSGNLVLLSGEEVSLVCISSPTRPATSVQWWIGSQQLTNVFNTNTTGTDNLYTVTSMVRFQPNRTRTNPNINCSTGISEQVTWPFTQQTVVILWPPDTPAINVTGLPWLENQTGKTLECTSSDYGNLPANTSWKKQLDSVSVIGNQLVFPALTDVFDGVQMSCQLYNEYTQIKSLNVTSSNITLFVQYAPKVFVCVNNTITENVTLNEGQSFTAECNVKGNPVPNVSWMHHTSNKTLMFGDIDRTEQNVYTCIANASSVDYPNYPFVTYQNLTVRVNYAPDVNLVLSNTDVNEEGSVDVICNARGRPDSYSYTFIQTWGSIIIPNKHVHNQGKLTLSPVQLEDSGKYNCIVNNGIVDRFNQSNHSAEVNVTVKVPPKIFPRQSVGESGNTFVRALGDSLNLSVPLYAFPTAHSVFIEGINATINNTRGKFYVIYHEALVSTVFYGVEVCISGHEVYLQISNITTEDFRNYTLVFINIIGTTKWTFSLISHSIPSLPKVFKYIGMNGTIPVFYMEKGFNGGYQQEFIIETYPFERDTWIEKLVFNETDERYLQSNGSYVFYISGLNPQTYKARIIAKNILGRTNVSDMLTQSFTIPAHDIPSFPTSGTSSALIGGTVGGAMAIVVIVIVGVILFRRNRFSKAKSESKMELHNKSHLKYEDEKNYGNEVITDNPQYVTADDVIRDNDNNVWITSSVQDADIYENAPTWPTRKVEFKNAVEHQKNIKDVLCYVDVAFRDKWNDHKKLVIHGLDNRTEYAKIDFLAKADADDD